MLSRQPELGGSSGLRLVAVERLASRGRFIIACAPSNKGGKQASKQARVSLEILLACLLKGGNNNNKGSLSAAPFKLLSLPAQPPRLDAAGPLSHT